MKDWRAILPAWQGDAPFVGPFSGELQTTGPMTRAEFQGHLDLAAATLRIGGAFEKPGGERARLTFRGRRIDLGLRLDAWTVDLRDQHLEGTLAIPDLSALRMTFTATASKLNLDRLLASPPKQARGSSGMAWAAPLPAPARSASGVSARGQVSIGNLGYHGLSLSGAAGEVRYQDGVLQVPDFQAKYQTGTIKAQIEMDLLPKIPRVRLTSNLQHLPTEPLLQALGYGPWRAISSRRASSNSRGLGRGRSSAPPMAMD